jgi:type IV secretory pathway TrbD component
MLSVSLLLAGLVALAVLRFTPMSWFPADLFVVLALLAASAALTTPEEREKFRNSFRRKSTEGSNAEHK